MSKKGGHHGGSWKVAYADFMTSMFALFLVLWIMGADEETKRAVEDYFQGRKTKIAPGERGVMDKQQREVFRTQPIDQSSKDLVSINELQQAMEQLRQQLANSSEVGDDAIRFEYTADGVRITAMDRAKKPFFEPNSSNLTSFGQFIMQTIGWQIERLPVQVEIEGHAQQEGAGDNRSGLHAWELSTERALSSEKALSDSGVKATQFFRVAGKGMTEPLDAANPESEDNRRIAIVLRPRPGEDPAAFRQKMQLPQSPVQSTAPQQSSDEQK